MTNRGLRAVTVTFNIVAQLATPHSGSGWVHTVQSKQNPWLGPASVAAKTNWGLRVPAGALNVGPNP